MPGSQSAPVSHIYLIKSMRFSNGITLIESFSCQFFYWHLINNRINYLLHLLYKIVPITLKRKLAIPAQLFVVIVSTRTGCWDPNQCRWCRDPNNHKYSTIVSDSISCLWFSSSAKSRTSWKVWRTGVLYRMPLPAHCNPRGGSRALPFFTLDPRFTQHARQEPSSPWFHPRRSLTAHPPTLPPASFSD